MLAVDNRPNQGDAVVEVAAPVRARRQRVLIVDDDPIVRLVYMNKFKQAGFDVECASDAKSAWLKIEAGLPDAILLDLVLPRISGIDLLKELKADSRLSLVPVFVFTNSFLNSMAAEATQHGAVGLFDKTGSSPEEIIAQVREAVYASALQPGQDASAEDGTLQEPAGTMEASPSPLDVFLAELPGNINAIREDLRQFARCTEDVKKIECLETLSEKIHGMTGSAGTARLSLVARTCSAIEGLLHEVRQKPQHLGISTSRTLSQAMDLLTRLPAAPEGIKRLSQETSPEAYVVDDDPICRLAVVKALERAGFTASSRGDPREGLAHLGVTPVNLIVLDVQMPGLDGFELCSQVRAASANSQTPVIFVTSHADFQSRSKSVLSGGDELIAKPFLFTELAVKALTYAMRTQLGLAGQSGNTAARMAAHPAGELGKQEIPTPAPPAGPETAVSPSSTETCSIPNSQGVLMMDDKGRLESINAVGASLVGYVPSELTGQHVDEFLSADLSFLLSAASNCHGGQSSHLVIARRKDGVEFPIQLTLRKVQGSASRRFAGLFRDYRPAMEDTRPPDFAIDPAKTCEPKAGSNETGSQPEPALAAQQRQVQELESKLAETVRELESERASHRQMREDYHQMLQTTSGMERKLEEQRQATLQARGLATELQERYGHRLDEIEALETQVRQLTTQKETLSLAESQCANLAEQCQEAQDRCQWLESELKRISGELDEQVNQNQRTARDRETSIEVSRRLERDLKESQEVIAGLQSDLEGLRGTNQEAEAAVDKVSSELAVHDAQRRQTEEARDALAAEAKELREEMETLKSTVARLEMERSVQEGRGREMQEAMDRALAQLEDQEAQRRQTEEGQDAVAAEAKKLIEELELLRSNIAGLEQERLVQEVLRKEMQQALDQASAQLEDQKALREQAKSERLALLSMTEELRSQLAASQDAAASLKQERDDLLSLTKDLQAAVERTGSEHGAEAGPPGLAKDGPVESSALVESLRNELARSKEAVAHLEHELDARSNVNAELQAALETTMADLKTFRRSHRPQNT